MDGYRNWLEHHTAYRGRTLADIVSRTRRISTMIDLAAAKTPQDVHVMLIQSDSFEQCSPSVRSQLKLAANLYIQFQTAATA